VNAIHSESRAAAKVAQLKRCGQGGQRCLIILLATTWTLDVDGVTDAADAVYAAANATRAGAAFVSHLLGALVAVHGPAATAVALPTLSVGNCKAGKHNNPQQQQLVSARTCHLGGAFVLVGLVSGRADCWSVEVWNAWSYSD